MSNVIKISDKHNPNCQQIWVLYQNAWKRFQSCPTEANEKAARELAEKWRESFRTDLTGGLDHAG